MPLSLIFLFFLAVQILLFVKSINLDKRHVLLDIKNKVTKNLGIILSIF